MAKKSPKQPATMHGLNEEDTAKLAAVLAGLRKQFGEGSIKTLTEAPNMGRFPVQTKTGSIGLDIAIGPMKRLPSGVWQTGITPGTIEVFGPESCGKTTLTLCMIANAQSSGGLCAYIDVEHSLDPLYSRYLGVKMEDLYWSQPDTGEQALNIAETLFKSGLYRIIVVDSTAALVPQSELEGEVGKSSMGKQAQMISQFFRMITPAMGEGCKTTLVMVNQIREKVGVFFGSPEVQPGGKALKFYSQVRMDIRRTKAIKEGGGEADDDGTVAQQIGHKMRVKLVKNKVAPPFRVAEFPLIYGKGIDITEELIDLCKLHGIDISGEGAWYYLDNMTFQGKPRLYEYLKNNPIRCYQLYDKLLTANMQKMGYNADGTPIPGALSVTESAHAQFEPPTEQELNEAAEVEAHE